MMQKTFSLKDQLHQWGNRVQYFFRGADCAPRKNQSMFSAKPYAERFEQIFQRVSS